MVQTYDRRIVEAKKRSLKEKLPDLNTEKGLIISLISALILVLLFIVIASIIKTVINL